MLKKIVIGSIAVGAIVFGAAVVRKLKAKRGLNANSGTAKNNIAGERPVHEKRMHS